MNILRRTLLLSSLASLTAPAIVRAGALMPARSRPVFIFRDGIHDDTEGLQALVNGHSKVFYFDTLKAASLIGVSGTMLITDTILVPPRVFMRGNKCTIHARGDKFAGTVFKFESDAELNNMNFRWAR